MLRTAVPPDCDQLDVAAPKRQSVLDVDAVVLGDAREAGGVLLADGAELPVRTVAVQLAEDHGVAGGGVLGQVVARDLRTRLVADADVRVADLAEVLTALPGLVDGDREDDLGDVRGQLLRVDGDDLVVTLALAGEVVAAALDGALRALLVVEEHEVLVGVDLVRAAADVLRHDRAGVEVEVRSGGGARLPAEADGERGDARRLLGQRDVATLAQVDSHWEFP